MPRPKTAIVYQERIATLAEEGYRSAAIFRKLTEEATKEGRNDNPSERTVRRLFDEHKVRKPEERRQYALFRWPDAMERGDLPWEATRPVLDLLRFMNDMSLGRPTLRVAKCYWHAYLAGTDRDTEKIYRDALILVAAERKRVHTGEETDMEGLEYFLAYAPWHEENEEAYDRALGNTGVTEHIVTGGDGRPEVWVYPLRIPGKDTTIESLFDGISEDVKFDPLGDILASQLDADRVRSWHARRRKEEG